tara:strand:- start:649 stop:1032 length:384 start_codon:yes stop_codon:yes gene_type:complete
VFFPAYTVPYKQLKITSESLLRFHRAIEVLRATGEREFPMQLALTFTYIAARDGCRQEDLQEALAMSSSSVSRNVTWLGPRHRLGKEGLKLVRRERDREDPKRYKLFLTPRGEQLKNLIEQQLTQPL